jgi:2-methylisocitrate lyase-like PEP mutase family enzyme
MQNGELTVEVLAEAGVKRISLATALYRIAMTAVRDAAQEARNGSFRFSGRALTTPDLNVFLRP